MPLVQALLLLLVAAAVASTEEDAAMKELMAKYADPVLVHPHPCKAGETPEEMLNKGTKDRFGRDTAYRLDSWTYLVTGGDIGIGYAVSKELARAGGTVVMGVTDYEHGRNASKRIEAETGSNRAVPVHMDLTSFDNTENFFKRIDGFTEAGCEAGSEPPPSSRPSVAPCPTALEVEGGAGRARLVAASLSLAAAVAAACCRLSL